MMLDGTGEVPKGTPKLGVARSNRARVTILSFAKSMSCSVCLATLCGEAIAFCSHTVATAGGAPLHSVMVTALQFSQSGRVSPAGLLARGRGPLQSLGL